MSSTFSLGSEDSEKRAPTGVTNRFSERVVFDHPVNVQIFDTNLLVVFRIGLSGFEMEIPALPFDLQMGLCATPGGFPPAFAAFLAAGKGALFASQGALRL